MQVNLSTGLIHQTVKAAGFCQHKMHRQCANHFPDTTASLLAGHQHNLLQRHCLNLRCVKKTHWWHGKSSCATSWVMKGNQWIMKGPFVRVVAVLCGNGGQRRIKTSSYFQKGVCSKLKTLGKLQIYNFLTNYAGVDPKQIQYPNIPKQLGLNWEHREGYGDPGPWTSRDRLVTIPNLSMVAPAIDLNLLSFQWRKNTSFQSFEIVPAKKGNSCHDHDHGYLRNFSWKGVKHKSSKMSEMMARHLATMSASVTHGEAWKLRTPIVMLQKQLTLFRTEKPASALPL